MLEGGYDLDALSSCATAVLATLAGVDHAAEAPSSGGPGASAVDAVSQLWSPG
jgi:acetoin utilization deacetylase AcuC-like enzyme